MNATATTHKVSAPRDGSAPPWFRLLPEDGFLTIALLVTVVFVTTASVQTVTQAWAPGMQILTATTAMGLLLGYVTVQQGRLPGWLVQTLAMVVGIAFAFQQTSDAVVGNRMQLLQRTGAWFNRTVLQHGTSNDNAVFLLFLAILSCLLAYISVWLVIRSRRPWLAAVANGVVLLINLNWATSDKTLFFLVLYLLSTLLLLVRFTLAENMRQWRARNLRFSPDLSWDFMQAGAIFAVIVLLLAYMLPAQPPNQSLTAWWNSSANPWQLLQQRFQDAFSGAHGSTSGAGALDFFGSGIQLVSSVSLPNVVILRYTLPNNLSNDGSQYLITRTFDEYNGENAWLASNTQPVPYPAQAPLPSSTADASVDTYNITIVRQPTGSPLFAPGDEAASFSLPSNVALSTATNEPVSWTSGTPVTNGTHYIAQGYVSDATVQELRQVAYPSQATAQTAPMTYPPSILALYLNNSPPAPPLAVKDAHRVTAGAPTMYDAAVDLENFLRTFTYTQTIQDAPNGQDAVTWFLSQGKGFCTYFATAMAVMGRALGMPTRIAAGFAAGKWDAQSNSYVVKGTEAHVWTQIYFAGYGWINFEPTSSFGKFNRSQAGGSSPLPQITPGAGAAGGATPPTRRRPNSQLPDTTGHAGTGPVQTLAVDAGLSVSLLIILLLLAVVFFSVWWRILYRGLTPAALAFARVTHLGKWAGAPPAPSQTSLEYTERLSDLLPRYRSAFRQLGTLYSRERYGGIASPDEAAETHQMYRRLQHALSPLIARRWRRAPFGLLRRGARFVRRQK